jgi:hypothetical protein
VQVAGRDGPEDGQLGRGIFVAEDVQRPVVHGRPSKMKMRMVEAGSEIGLEHDWLDPRCALFSRASFDSLRTPLIETVALYRPSLRKIPWIRRLLAASIVALSREGP